MADGMRVTLPLVNRSQVIDPAVNPQNIPEFNLQDITKVAKPMQQSELLMQNNTLLAEEDSTAILTDLLKDPAVTVSFLKNIMMLKEVISLIGGKNEPFTEEIEQMFRELMIAPEGIENELLMQEGDSTKFKGELFDFLRTLLYENPENEQVEKSVVDFLKSSNQYTTKQDIFDAISNSLSFLSESLKPSTELSEKLENLAQAFRAPDAEIKFSELKEELLSIFSDVQESILFSPKMEKTISILTYNLSRYSADTEQFQNALDKIVSMLESEEHQELFSKLVMDFLQSEQPEVLNQLWQDLSEAQREGIPIKSKVLEILTEIVKLQTENEEVMRSNSEQLQKIIESLLSSPTNFTPLLHFIIPVEYMDVQSFMEMWINPNGEDDEWHRPLGEDDNIHMLMVFDIGNLGRFEMELFVRDKTIDFSLFCPPEYTGAFEGVGNDLGGVVRGLGYRFGDVRIDKLERSRSLLEVFKSLPYKRTGIDVKI